MLTVDLFLDVIEKYKYTRNNTIITMGICASLIIITFYKTITNNNIDSP